MKRSRFTEVQVAYALRQAEAGMAVIDVCRSLGISEATFYIWKKKYAHLGVAPPCALNYYRFLDLLARYATWSKVELSSTAWG